MWDHAAVPEAVPHWKFIELLTKNKAQLQETKFKRIMKYWGARKIIVFIELFSLYEHKEQKSYRRKNAERAIK